MVHGTINEALVFRKTIQRNRRREQRARDRLARQKNRGGNKEKATRIPRERATRTRPVEKFAQREYEKLLPDTSAIGYAMLSPSFLQPDPIVNLSVERIRPHCAQWSRVQKLIRSAARVNGWSGASSNRPTPESPY